MLSHRKYLVCLVYLLCLMKMVACKERRMYGCLKNVYNYKIYAAPDS